MKGSNCVFQEETAQVFADAGIELLGVERQTVGPDGDTKGVHKILLGADMALIEGVWLDEVKPGDYFLCAQPLKLAGVEGSPCRAVLIETEERKKREYRSIIEDAEENYFRIGISETERTSGAERDFF